jgi:hypothetical protein
MTPERVDLEGMRKAHDAFELVPKNEFEERAHADRGHLLALVAELGRVVALEPWNTPMQSRVFCVFCIGAYPDHKPDCPYQAALALLPRPAPGGGEDG